MKLLLGLLSIENIYWFTLQCHHLKYLQMTQKVKRAKTTINIQVISDFFRKSWVWHFQLILYLRKIKFPKFGIKLNEIFYITLLNGLIIG